MSTATINGTTYRTEQLSWTRKRAFGHVTPADVVGRLAIFRTAEGERMVGTITGTDRLDQYLVVGFPDGRWGRLNDVVTLATEVTP